MNDLVMPSQPMSLDKLLEIVEQAAPHTKFGQAARRMLEERLGEPGTASVVASRPRDVGRRPRLTIGMATYDDFDGVFFSVHALQMYHGDCLDEIEILIVDNNPDGPCGQALRDIAGLRVPVRYVPIRRPRASAIKEVVVREANGDFVLCMDCHVLLVPGSLRQLLDYLDANPDTVDLLQGPLVGNGLEPYASHFADEWGSGMWGRWSLDHRATDSQHPPFEIPMQGLGLFCCRRATWPGFNPRFRGFGAEEGYLHEKFRQAGGRVLCLPFLRWLHRFTRPRGVPYPLRNFDRLRNYLIGFRELNLPWTPIVEHFNALWTVEEVTRTVSFVERELASPLFGFDSIVCLRGPGVQGLQEAADAAVVTITTYEVTPAGLHPDIARAASLREACLEASLRGLTSLMVLEVTGAIEPQHWDRLASQVGERRIGLAEGPFALMLDLRAADLERVVDDVPAARVDVASWLKRQAAGSLKRDHSPLNDYLVNSLQA